jgi:hypothetical protein
MSNLQRCGDWLNGGPDEDQVNNKIIYVQDLLTNITDNSPKHEDIKATLVLLQDHHDSLPVAKKEIQSHIPFSSRESTSSLEIDADPDVKNIINPIEKKIALVKLKEMLKIFPRPTFIAQQPN